MRVLVTGASGMIGTKLCQFLDKEKIQYVGVDRNKNIWDKEVNKKVIQVDLLNQKWENKITGNITHIIHLAANARVTDSIENPLEAQENVLSTISILEFARRRGITKVIFASSKEVYGTIMRTRLREDDARLDKGENPYCASKVAGEAFCSAYEKCFGIRYVVLRFSNVYGPYDKSARAVPEFIRKCLQGEQLVVYGRGKKLDFVHSEDVCSGILLALHKFDLASGKTFNIAYGRSTSLLSLAKLVVRKNATKNSIICKSNRIGEILEYTADITYARSLLGYSPKVSLSQGIADTVEWFAGNHL